MLGSNVAFREVVLAETKRRTPLGCRSFKQVECASEIHIDESPD